MDAQRQIKSSMSDEQIDCLRALYAALKPFRDLQHHTLPMSYVTAALLVAMDEGRGVSEYAEKAGISPTVMTRNLLDIGDRNRQREEGLGLVTQERDLFDLRKHRAKLTPKGKKLLHDVVEALRTVPKGGR